MPIAVAGPGIRRDLVSGFDEVQCAPGALGWVQGRDLMPMVLNFLDRAKLAGLMDTPDDQPYWPGKRKPFRLYPFSSFTSGDTYDPDRRDSRSIPGIA